jgi:hypothetical protein
MAAKEHTFVSKYTQHEILRRPKMEVPLASGGWIPSQQRVSYPFKPSLDRESGRLVGQLTVREGQDVLDTDHSGTLAPDKEIGIKRDAVQFLLDHRAYGEDFWLLGHDPGTLYPRPVDWREDVNRASIFGDEEALVGMIEKERRTHGRGDLIAEAGAALKLLREAIAYADAQAAEKAPKAKPKAAA